MSHSDLCHPTWSPANHRYFDGPHRIQQTLQQDLGLTGGMLDHLPLLGFSNQMCCMSHSVTPSSIGSIFALPFPRARRKDLSYSNEPSSLFASSWHWTHRAWNPVHNVHNQETMVACKAAALINTTWDPTSSRDSSLCLRMWLPHLLVSQICPCWMMQITIQMLRIQLSVRITKSTGTMWAALCYLLWSSFEGICVSAAWQLWEYTDKELGIQSTGMVWKNKTRIIYAADISCSSQLAFTSEVLLMVKDGRQEFKSPRAAWSTRPTLVCLPVCKCYRNSASAVVTATTLPHKVCIVNDMTMLSKRFYLLNTSFISSNGTNAVLNNWV